MLTGGVMEKKGMCLKMREQLGVLEKETAAKLSEMDQYNKDMQVQNGLINTNVSECPH